MRGMLISAATLVALTACSSADQPTSPGAQPSDRLSTPALTAAQIIPPAEAQALTGKTYGEWAAALWQYSLSKPVTDPNNPLVDPTGAGCKAGQPNGSPVFFLAGAGPNEPATRDECTMPGGKALFFPLISTVVFHVPGDGLDTPELLRAVLLSFFGPVTELHASIDGVPVEADLFSFAACTGGDPACASAFSLTLTGNNVFAGSPAGVGRRGMPALRAGVYAPAVADGFYLMLAPLPAGPHSINFGAQVVLGGTSFSFDMTYNLTVKEH